MMVREFLDRMVAEGKVAGCAAAILRNGEVVFQEFVGEGRSGEPMDGHTVFRLASMTKAVTAVAVLLCVQGGTLSLDLPVTELLPAFGDLRLAIGSERGFRAGERTGVFTLRNLLTHSAGIGAGAAGDAQFAEFGPQEGDTLASAVERYAGMLADFRPGTAQAYSPVVGFDIAARMVEVASGIPYGQFVKKRIFDPLGMRETSYFFEDFEERKISSTYRSEGGKLFERRPERNFDGFPLHYTGGGAGLLSTLGDYVRFAEMLRRAREGEGEILSKESAEELSRPQLDTGYAGISPEFNWGLGVRSLMAQTFSQPLPAGSFGWSGAYGTHFWVDPRHRLTAVYMHNSDTYGGAGAPHTLAFERTVMQEYAMES